MLICELARETGLTTDTVRFYVRRGLLTPETNGKGGRNPYQVFTAEHVRAKLICTAQSLGLSLKDLAAIGKRAPSVWRADYDRNHIRPRGDDPVADSSQIQRVVSRVNSRMTASVALQLKWAAGAPRSKNGVCYARDSYQCPQRGPTSRAGESLRHTAVRIPPRQS
jgi:DNA-binding transcriptional MerR regulator